MDEKEDRTVLRVRTRTLSVIFVRRAAIGRLEHPERLVIGPQAPEIAFPYDYQRVSSPVHKQNYLLLNAGAFP